MYNNRQGRVAPNGATIRRIRNVLADENAGPVECGRLADPVDSVVG